MSYCVISDRIYISQLKYISVLLSEVYFILKRYCNNYMSYANDNKENCKKQFLDNLHWATFVKLFFPNKKEVNSALNGNKEWSIIWRLKPDTLLVIHQSLIFDIVSPKVSSVWQYDIQHRTRHGPAFRIPKSLYFQLSSGLSTVASYYYKWWHLIACCAGVSLMGAW